MGKLGRERKKKGRRRQSEINTESRTKSDWQAVLIDIKTIRKTNEYVAGKRLLRGTKHLCQRLPVTELKSVQASDFIEV